MTGPAPDVAAARNAVRAALADVPAGALVLVACSGGPDSVALAAATAFVAPREGRPAGAVCVDHGLLPESRTVADDAVATCRRLGLEPALVERVAVAGKGGPEAAARAARYGALEAVAGRTGAAVVLLGHTLDDQAETVLLGLARGSGSRSLAGMAAVRGLYRRPFLGLRRSQTAAVCAALGLPTWSDPSNRDVRSYRRAAVRHEVLPALERALGSGVVPALARSADLLRDDADLLESLADDLLSACTRLDAPGRLELDVGRLAEAHPSLRGRALRSAAVAVGCPPGALAAAHVSALSRLLTHWHGQGELDLPGGVTAGRACGRLTFRLIGAQAAGTTRRDERPWTHRT